MPFMNASSSENAPVYSKWPLAGGKGGCKVINLTLRHDFGSLFTFLHIEIFLYGFK